LLDTPYGRLLAVKILIFAATLLVASDHLRRHAALIAGRPLRDRPAIQLIVQIVRADAPAAPFFA
jgi:hypothetical protein